MLWLLQMPFPMFRSFWLLAALPLLLAACSNGGPDEGVRTSSAGDDKGQGLEVPAASETNPSLLFAPEDLPAVRAKAKEREGRALVDALRERSARWHRMPPADYPMDSGIAPRVSTTRVTELAFAGWLFERPDYLDHAAEVLVYLAESTAPEDLYANSSLDLAVGNAAQLFALGYDLVRPRLSEAEDRLLREEIEAYGDFLFSASTTGETDVTDAYHFFGEEREGRYASNWNTVTHGNLGLCALVLGDRPDWLARAEERVRKYFLTSNDATGAPYESPAYMGYGKQNGILFADALRRATGRDLLSGEASKHLREIPVWLAHNLYPGGGKVLPINQGGPNIPISDFLLYLNARYESRLGHWAWLRLLGDPEADGGSGTWGAEDHAGHSANLGFSLLWLDPELEPLSPEAAGLERSARFEQGIAVARSGWEPGDSLFSTICGRGIGGIWNHADEGSFTFQSDGVIWADDPGTGFTESRFHNVLSVDGEGQDQTGGPHPTQGEILGMEDRGDRVVVQTRPAPAYRRKAGLEDYTRTFVYGREPRPFLVIVDRPRKAEEAAYGWNLYAGKGQQVVLQEAAARIDSPDFDKACAVEFLWPAAPELSPHPVPADEMPDRAGLRATLMADSPELVTALIPYDAGMERPQAHLESGPEGARNVVLAWPDGSSATIRLGEFHEGE